MKKVYMMNLMLGVGLTVLTSCMEIDNFDEPEARISGKLIDSTTGIKQIRLMCMYVCGK